VANEEIDPGVDAELDDDEIWYSDDPAEDKKVSFQTKIRAFVPVVVLIAAAVFYLPTTVGGKITLSSDRGIEFGQSVSQIITCAGTPINLTITPSSTFTNASDSGIHYFKAVKVSGIPAQCVGIDFNIRAFDDSSSNPLAIFDSDNTVAVVRVVSTSSYSAGTGSYGTTVSSAAGSFTTSFDSPVAVATSVAKLTIETGPQYFLNQTIPCGSAGTFTIVNNVVTSSSSNCSGSLTIPVGVTSINGAAFYDRNLIGVVSLPSGLISIGDSAFYNQNIATANYSIVIPSSVTTISGGTQGAFYKTKANSIIFESPSNVTALHRSTFREAPRLTSISIPDGVLTIIDRGFAGTSLTVSPFSNTSRLTDLGENTFLNAQFISFVIPSGVTQIRTAVFGAPKMKRLTIPDGVTSISPTAFPSAAQSAALNCVIYSGVNSTIQNYAFPNGVVPTPNIANCPAL
jgi:hypothetical protein